MAHAPEVEGFAEAAVMRQTHREPRLARAALADEEDFGVRVLDLVRRGRQGRHGDFRRSRLGDKFRQIPHPDAAAVVAGEGAAFDRRSTPRVLTSAVWPSSTRRQRPVSTSHSRTVSSAGHRRGRGVRSALHATRPTLSRVAFEHAQAAPRLHVPQPHGLVSRAGEGAALIGAPRHAS